MKISDNFKQAVVPIVITIVLVGLLVALPVAFRSSSTSYDVYIPSQIFMDEQKTYIVSVLERAQPKSSVVIHINSFGGSAAAAFEIINSINDAKARNVHIIGVISGEAASAAALIAFSCDDLIVKPFSEVVVHTPYRARVGVFGNVEKVREPKSDFIISRSYLRQIVEPFLTEDEMHRVFELDEDLALDANTVKERFSNYKKGLPNNKAAVESVIK